MSSESTTSLEERIAAFIEAQLPQVRMHGGDFTVDTEAIHDGEETSVRASVELSGTCSDCGLAPMTKKAVQRRLIQEFSAVKKVAVTVDKDQQPNQQKAPF